MGLKKSLISCFSRLESIRHSDPELTPENWCRQQPCIKVTIASREILLSQPASTLYVYLLAVVCIGVAIYFWWFRGNELSRLWWGISLSAWGIGAFLAGTSYQAFGYEIKCAGRESCIWTSWWELVYLMFQQISMSAMLVAVAYCCTAGTMRTLLSCYAMASSLLYVIVVFIGGFVPVKPLITFGFMVRFSLPAFVLMLIVSGWRYCMLGNSADLVLVGAWLLLLFISAAYYLYDELEITEKLWEQGAGIWFSQNDLLHIGLILWMLYIALFVADRVKDTTVSIIPG
ncbi:hypothetical protein [Desulfosediminicola ganghwensis]|uniref:hypothetical protein n=1 Tax=Desulfosediminicola ganghwensis TaxID=2569540 RepID=UPI0010ABBA45|nr:hypothetical protein [Desulfosediminicola ganghwensis]